MSVAAGVRGSAVGPRRPVTTRRQSQRLESGRSTKPPPRAPLVRTPPPPRPALVPAAVPNAARALVPGLARLGPKGLAAAALLLGAAWLWGWLNSRGGSTPPEVGPGEYVMPVNGWFVVDGIFMRGATLLEPCPGNTVGGSGGAGSWPFRFQGFGNRLILRDLSTSYTQLCGEGSLQGGIQDTVIARLVQTGGHITNGPNINPGGTGFGNQRTVFPITFGYKVTNISYNNLVPDFFAPGRDTTLPVPVLPGSDDVPAPLPIPVPVLPLPRRPVPQAPPGLEPLPVPGTLPDGAPSTSPGPGRFPVPSLPGALPVPSAPVLPAPVGPQPGPDGTLQPQQPVTGPGVVVVPVPITEPGTEIFGPGVIGQPGQRPPATLDGIAGELGRIEQKLRALLPMIESPAIEFPEPPAEVNLAPVLELLEEISAELFAPYLGDGYELQGPCARDAEGNPLPPDLAEWSPGIGKLNRLGRQIDALALLMQYAKDQRQPICKGKPIGEEVSVNFIEVP